MSLVNNDYLYKYWIHSYEEDEQGKKFFRPTNFEFPPSFGRDAFNIKRTGEIVFSSPGTDDRIVGKIGRFHIRDSDKIDVNVEGRRFTMTVLLCASDLLVIVK